MKPLAWLWAAAALLSCSGLLLDKGNAFPCDFNLPEAERDRACPPGFVCGVSDSCIRYRNEGPQFEGAPAFPEFNKARQIHPLVLQQSVSYALPYPSLPTALYVVAQADGGSAHYRLPTPFQVTAAQGAVPPLTAGALHGQAVVFRNAQNQAYSALENQAPQPIPFQGGPAVAVDKVRHFRALGQRDGGVVLALAREPGGGGNPSGMGEVVEQGSGFVYQPYLFGLAGRAFDGRFAPAQAVTIAGGAAPLPVVISQQHFLYRDLAQNWNTLNNEEDFDSTLTPVRLAHDRTFALWTVTASLLGKDRVLSTWQLARSLTAPSMSRLWPDCAPCGSGEIKLATPTVDKSGPAVDVVCQQPQGLTTVQVVGSFATDPGKACQLQPLTPPIDLTQVERVDDTVGEVVVVTGKRGQIWLGPSIGALQPLFLDRVPQAVGTFTGADGGLTVPLAVAGGQLSAPLSENGFVSFRLKELSDEPLLEEAQVEAVVNEASGWLMLSSGDLAQLRPRGAGTVPELWFGPRLVDPRGEPAQGPYFGEAFTSADGQLVSMVLGASDSLYFWSQPAEGQSTPNALPPLSPQLTPEPTFPIRSLTLERSPLGTDGKSFLRGYLVTSRNLYQYTLGGSPPRWEARPIVVASGEPVEVWMDHPRGGLGRVGFRDGQVFTLPGAFPLVKALSTADAGVDRVLDYENLGGWPVALAQSGLYLAQWERLPDGSLDNRLPNGTMKAMGWQKITLADGSEPWRHGGLLRVVRRAPVTVGGQVLTTFVLSVFTAGEVHEVGSVTRLNAAQ